MTAKITYTCDGCDLILSEQNGIMIIGMILSLDSGGLIGRSDNHQHESHFCKSCFNKSVWGVIEG